MSPLERAKRLHVERLRRYGFKAFVYREAVTLAQRLECDLFWSKFEAAS